MQLDGLKFGMYQRIYTQKLGHVQTNSSKAGQGRADAMFYDDVIPYIAIFCYFIYNYYIYL